MQSSISAFSQFAGDIAQLKCISSETDVIESREIFLSLTAVTQHNCPHLFKSTVSLSEEQRRWSVHTQRSQYVQ